MKKKLLLIFLVFLVYGCNSDQSTENNAESVPLVIVTIEKLPEWLQERIDDICKSYVGKTYFPEFTKQAEIYRGEYNKQTVYLIQALHSSCWYCFVDENCEPISNPTLSRPTGFNENLESILQGSTNWKLIFQIVDGVVTVTTRSLST